MRKFTITYNNVTYEVEVEEVGGPEHLRVVVDGTEHLVDVVAEEPPPGQVSPAAPPRPRPRAGLTVGTPGEVTAPLPGTVLKVLVKEGDSVKADTVACVLEAMKMETQIQTGQAGRVAEVLVEPGQKVEGGQTLVRLEEE